MTDIVTFVPGDYTPGAETSLRNAVNLINAAWAQANIKEAAYAGKMDAIETWMPVASDRCRLTPRPTWCVRAGSPKNFASASSPRS